jgi:hypothetical protein
MPQKGRMSMMKMGMLLVSSMTLRLLMRMKMRRIRVISSKVEPKRRKRIKGLIWRLRTNLESERLLWLSSIRYF